MITFHLYNIFAICSPWQASRMFVASRLHICDKVNEHISQLQVTGLLGSIWCHLSCLHKGRVPQGFSCTLLGPRDSEVNIKKLFSLSVMFTFALIVTRKDRKAVSTRAQSRPCQKPHQWYQCLYCHQPAVDKSGTFHKHIFYERE